MNTDEKQEHIRRCTCPGELLFVSGSKFSFPQSINTQVEVATSMPWTLDMDLVIGGALRKEFNEQA